MYSGITEHATLLAHNDSVAEAWQQLLICTSPHVVGMS